MESQRDENAPIRQLLIRLETAIASRDTAALHALLSSLVHLDMSALSEGEAGAQPCETVIHGWLEELSSRPWQLHALTVTHAGADRAQVTGRGHAIRAGEGFDRQGSWDFALKLDNDHWRISGYRFTPDS